MKKKPIRVLASLLIMIFIAAAVFISFSSSAAKATVTTIEMTDELAELMSQARSFILVRHKQLGNSHYAYTDSISDHSSMNYEEYSYYGGSKLCLVTLEDNGDGTVNVSETELKNSSGIIRDPDVSEDGTRFVFSWKKSEKDDYHIYEYDLTNDDIKQLTFGTGVADVEPVYTANGSIVFNSTRDIQTVDCWYTPVMNLYIMDADGSNITRVGYDQVHTTYPTSTDDGRIIYTRWDYNDRNQMYVQALFQMFPDGSNQTELFGNNINNPTTLLHTRQIPGTSDKYVTIISGHHLYQVGKIAVVDVSNGRNDPASVKYLKSDNQTRELSSSNTRDIDNTLFQQGTVYKYPYAYSENLFTCAMSTTYEKSDKRNADFDIVLMNSKGNTQKIVKSQNGYPASQFVPIKTRDIFNRQSMLDYARSNATYYMANVYLGEGMTGVKEGTAKYLRVVALNFRSYAVGATIASGTGSSDPYSPISTGNGAWDVKEVLGIVEICDDGSALFSIPAGVPVYFQVLDENGDLIQTMRSWTTAQNGEYFSCVGCHLDKNTAPPTTLTTTQAMKKGVQQIQPDKWMSTVEEYKDYDPYSGERIGFDYLTVVQPIFNRSCVTCHSNTDAAYKKIKISELQNSADEQSRGDVIFTADSEWQYTKTAPAAGWYEPDFDSSSWESDRAPFGRVDTAPYDINTVWKDSKTLWLRKTVQINQYDVEAASLQLDLAYTDAITVYVNGTKVFSASGAETSYTKVILDEECRSAFRVGANVIAVKVDAADSASYFGLGLKGVSAVEGSVTESKDFFGIGSAWKYFTSSSDTLGSSGDWTGIEYDDSSWSSHEAPLGDRAGGTGTDWSNESPYLWVRKTFTIDDLSSGTMNLKANIFYDDDFKLYINGQLIYEDGNWNDQYTVYTFDSVNKYLVEGTNVISACLHQHVGGYEFDMGLTGEIVSGEGHTSEAVISLEDYGVYATRMQKYFPLSYLVLTGSTPQGGGIQWVASHSGNLGSSSYTKFISSMSQCEVLKPYEGGSTKSSMIELLRKGHGGLTDAEIAAISCWIDLEVPCFGSYEPEGYTNWSTNDQRAAVEETNKREFYDMLDRCAKIDRAGLTPDGEITVTYGNNLTATGKGIVSIFATKNFTPGAAVTVTLPEGEKYLGLSLCSRVGESVIYCPDGTFSFKIPASASNIFPAGFANFEENQITARVVPASELIKVRNLALNSYDLTDSEKAFPHVSSSTATAGTNQNSPRNVIDGFTANREAGGYPNQAWQPDELKDGDDLTIDFGRKVNVSELVIRVRSAGGDSYFTSCTAEFSDGTTKELSLIKSAENQHFDLGSIDTTYVKLTNFKVADSSKSVAITEIQAIGCDIID